MISVIIPTLNEGKHIGKTIDALNKVDYSDFEIIIVDGNSKDKTRDIAKKKGAIVILEKRKGIGLGRNVGVKNSKGDILLFIDADTIVPKELLKEVNEAIENGYKGGTAIVAGDTNSFTTKWLWRKPSMWWTHFTILMKRPMFATNCCFYTKELFNKLGGFNEEFPYMEDLDLSWRAGKHGNFKVLNSTVKTSDRRLQQNFIKHYIFHIASSVYFLIKHKPLYNSYKECR
ncbi:MAG: glycosyltransferase [Candidatus Diapherotrites archaeon]|nr:glycosyltransferase [Candidatus Diapherotrites archaeon]